MDLEITVGPAHLALHEGNSVLITERNGQISWPSDKGLYFFDTRLISSWSVYANGEPWELLNAGNITHYASRTFLTNRVIITEDGEIPPRTLGLVLSRSISGGVSIQRDPTNFPVQYRGANVPQAWAAGSAFAFLQMILGFQPDAPRGRLYIDPRLPAWLPDLTVMDLQLGTQSFDVRFWRDGEETHWEVLKGNRDMIARRSYASGSHLAVER